jgi:tetratricopeptide (TPR) repeat protein
MRHLAALLLLLAGCSSLTSEERSRLADHQSRAQIYFEGSDYGRAMDQIDRGLELDPDDYKLKSMRAGILLLASTNSQGTDHRRLDEATALLAAQFDTRSIGRHEPHLLLNYARAMQKQGLRHLGEAIRLEGQATRAPQAEIEGMKENASEQRRESNRCLDESWTLFGELVNRGEYLRVVHNHRLQIAVQRGQDEAFVKEAEAYLKQATAASDLTKKRIEETKNIDHEKLLMRDLRDLRNEEVEVRNVVAEFLYARKKFHEAKEQLDKMIDLGPRRVSDYYNRGRVLLELGRVDDAKADFRRFLADGSVPVTSDKAVFALQVINR